MFFLKHAVFYFQLLLLPLVSNSLIYMKKFLLSTLVIMASLNAWADYNFMVFNYSNGEAVAIQADGLSITVEGNQLEITNSKGESLSIEASALASMQFTNTDPAGIKDILSVGQEITVFNLEGICVGKFESIDHARNSLAQGIYIIKNLKGETVKLILGK